MLSLESDDIGPASQSANPLQKNQQDKQSAAVVAVAGLRSSHLGQIIDTMPGTPGHQLSHSRSSLAAGASPMMHPHATQHVNPAHLQQAQAAYGIPTHPLYHTSLLPTD